MRLSHKSRIKILLKTKKLFFRDHVLKVIKKEAKNSSLALIDFEEKSKKDEKSTVDLAESILFKNLIRSREDIKLYDVGEDYYKKRYYISFFLALFLFFFSKDVRKKLKKRDWNTRLLLFLWQYMFPFMSLMYLKRVSEKYIERIIYCPRKRVFKMRQRNFIVPNERDWEIDQNKIMYTQDRFLNQNWVNYLNMETLDGYYIHEEKAWKNFRLWTHLIKQNPSKFMNKKTNKNIDKI